MAEHANILLKPRRPNLSKAASKSKKAKRSTAWGLWLSQRTSLSSLLPTVSQYSKWQAGPWPSNPHRFTDSRAQPGSCSVTRFWVSCQDENPEGLWDSTPRFVTGNGISRQETGVGFGPAGAQQQGQWQYTAPNGQVQQQLHLQQLIPTFQSPLHGRFFNGIQKRSLHGRTLPFAQRKHDHGHGFGHEHGYNYAHRHPPRKSRPLRTGLRSVRFSGGQNVKFRAPDFKFDGPGKVQLSSGLSNLKLSGPDIKLRFGQNVRLRSGLPSFKVNAPDINLSFGQKVKVRSGLSSLKLDGPDVNLRIAPELNIRSPFSKLNIGSPFSELNIGSPFSELKLRGPDLSVRTGLSKSRLKLLPHLHL